MYPTIKAEMARKNMTITELANVTGIRYQTLSEKLRGNYGFTVAEAKKIKEALGVDISLEDLFERKP